MGRRLAGGVLVGFGLVAASLAWVCLSITRTVLDPERSEAIAEDVYRDPEVRAQLEGSMATAIDAAIPEGADVLRLEITDAAGRALDDPAVDIATLAAEIHTEEEALNPNVVKAVGSPIGERRLRALYFTRATAPAGDGPRYHHIGLYAYRRAALERFVSLPPSPLEKQEKLEQLRALEAGMRIDVTIVDTVPRGVDTQADLETARSFREAG